ncbi:MAG: putative DNA-binding domain-containing protein [Pseudoxanthomonas suwonensis]|nr:putative DNA-binding domain-containing protein [Pseudoxanthomonas suwonensis]
MADAEFIAQQRAFTAWLRHPEAHAPPPGVDPRRLQVYRELFHGSIEGLLSGGFPQLRARLGQDGWRLLVARFRREHHCRTPLFPEVGGEFVDWLQGLSDIPSWQHPLAHFERMEAELLTDDTPLPACDRNGDLLAGIPLISPHVRVLAYAWPVHRPESLQDAVPPHPTLLLMHRRADGSVRCSEASALLYRLLELLEPAERSGRASLLALADEAALPDPAAFVEEGVVMLQRLHAESVLLGTQVDGGTASATTVSADDANAGDR